MRPSVPRPFAIATWRQLFCVLPLLAACDARFTDERPQQLSQADDAGVGAASDGGALADGGGATEALIASGTFEGRSGDEGRGAARLGRRAGGGFALELGADFFSTSVPGPVAVLSTRPDLGTELKPSLGDLEVGPLVASSGAQVIGFAADPGARRYLWVYCKPFGVEIARAALRDAP